MSLMNGVWHDAKLDPPPDSATVLCVKENKKGLRTLCFGSHWQDRPWDNGWVTGGGCNNIIFWMPLPKIPTVGNRVIIETDWKQTGDELQRDFHDCVNELCQQCGKYKQEHNGACDGCRWLKPRRGW